MFSIARVIDDPVTWRNFALVCRSAAKASKQLQLSKMDLFATLIVDEGFHGCPCCDGMFTSTKSTLPNGKKHGLKTCISTDGNGIKESRTYKTYENGVLKYHQEQEYSRDGSDWKLQRTVIIRGGGT